VRQNPGSTCRPEGTQEPAKPGTYVASGVQQSDMVYLVTGANRGIGLELVRLLLSRGATVIATTRDRAGALELIDTGARVLELDVSDPASIEALGSKLGDTAIDVLINNAGVSSTSKLLGDCSGAEFARVFAVNSTGPVLVTRALMGPLRKGSRKVVVNISSQLASIRNNTGGSSYGYRASKAALNMLTVCMANELRAEGFTCVCMHPGWVKTRMGGDQAPMTVEQSARFLLDQVERMNTGDSGSFRNYDGSTLPW